MQNKLIYKYFVVTLHANSEKRERGCRNALKGVGEN